MLLNLERCFIESSCLHTSTKQAIKSSQCIQAARKTTWAWPLQANTVVLRQFNAAVKANKSHSNWPQLISISFYAFGSSGRTFLPPVPQIKPPAFQWPCHLTDLSIECLNISNTWDLQNTCWLHNMSTMNSLQTCFAAGVVLQLEHFNISSVWSRRHWSETHYWQLTVSAHALCLPSLGLVHHPCQRLSQGTDGFDGLWVNKLLLRESLLGPNVHSTHWDFSTINVLQFMSRAGTY